MQNKADMKEFVINLLKSKLPSTYYYHDLEHTLYVLDKAVEIGKHEGCTESEIELLTVAALWHDSGYTNTYAGHEVEGCKLVHQYLPAFGFSEHEIETICGMIMATKIPQLPQNKLEEIIADADLEYLGTESAAVRAEGLFKELKHLNPTLTNAQWNQTQISFLQKHHYFTNFCKQNREPVKTAYLNKLEKNIE